MKGKTSKGKKKLQGAAAQVNSKSGAVFDLRLPKIAISPVLTKVFIAVLLLSLCAGAVGYKIYLLNKLPFFDPDDGEAFFWTESAFHFRHFLMVAEGKKIPSTDHEIQYPEGLDTVRYVTPVMEKVSGMLYRLFCSGVPAQLFLVYFSNIFSTLSVLAIFLLPGSHGRPPSRRL